MVRHNDSSERLVRSARPFDHEPAPIRNDGGDPAALDPTAAELRRAALEQTIRNLRALPVLLVVFGILHVVLVRDQVTSGSAWAWLSIAVAAGAVTAVARRELHRRSGDGAVARACHAVLLGSIALDGAVVGSSTWVVARAPAELVAVCALVPAIAGAIAAVVAAGRADVVGAFGGPLVACTTVGLLDSTNHDVTAVVAAVVCYGVAICVLHRSVSTSVIDSLGARTRGERLLRLLAEERATLTELNASLTTTNAQLAHLATRDPLTGLYNRRGALESIDRALAEPVTPLSILYLDLDRFKAVNDSVGHRGGDQFLVVLADRIGRAIDPECIAGRIGGDEFVVALPGHDLARAAAVASRLVDVLGQPVRAENRELPSSVSIGVATHPSHGATSTDLLRNANAALHHAKRSGRNRLELFESGMQADRDRELAAELELRRALDHGEILPFFQPEIDAASGRVVGAELLARWLRRDGTVENAAGFIEIAKRTGLLERLTERVLTQARPHIRRLASLGLPDGFRFRVNLGPASTDRSWRDNPIDELVRGIDPNLLTVDVRESAVSADLPAAAGTLAAFRARGGRVCLDDFARGVSSLSLLRRLPIDEVRIDRQAIDSIAVHPHDRAIVRSIIAVVREIGLAVTAEGVETGAQADALIALGCVRQQGHLYSTALPADAFEAFLLARLAEGYVMSDVPAHGWDPGDLA